MNPGSSGVFYPPGFLDRGDRLFDVIPNPPTDFVPFPARGDASLREVLRGFAFLDLPTSRLHEIAPNSGPFIRTRHETWPRRGPIPREPTPGMCFMNYPGWLFWRDRSGASILTRVPHLRTLAEVAANHHEKLDGSGYHRGVGGENLDRPSRILAIADIYDALAQERPYREAMPKKKVLSILQKESGEKLCPASCEAMVDVVENGGPEGSEPQEGA